MSGVQTLTVSPEDTDLRLDRWFKKHFPGLAYARLQRALRKGEVRVDGKRAKADLRLASGQAVRVPPLDAAPPKVSHPSRFGVGSLSDADVEFVRSLVIYKDDDVIAIDKPPGLAVQGGTGTTRHLDGLLDGLRYDAAERPKLIHRLDRDTSGVLLLARNRAAAAEMGRAFRHKTARKVYWAVLVGVPEMPDGVIDMVLGKVASGGGERVMAGAEEGKRAISEFQVLETAGKRASAVALWPRTGRTHQLRVHMAALGCPILGDGKYGEGLARLEGAEFPKGLMLHARALEIPGLPRITAGAPKPFLETCELLGFLPKSWPQDPFADE